MTHLDSDNYAKLLQQLKRHEGTKRDANGKHIAYRCTAGALTIGYGHNLDANPVSGIRADSRLNESQACRLLTADTAAVEEGLAQALPFALELDAVRYAVLVNMAFNIGLGVPGGRRGLLSFHNTLMAIERCKYDEAASRMLQSKWARQVGRRAVELSEQMRTGQWQR